MIHGTVSSCASSAGGAALEEAAASSIAARCDVPASTMAGEQDVSAEKYAEAAHVRTVDQAAKLPRRQKCP
jgi:hypothetical protein